MSLCDRFRVLPPAEQHFLRSRNVIPAQAGSHAEAEENQITDGNTKLIYNEQPEANMSHSNLFTEKAQEIIAAGQFFYQAGWSSATSSNYSMRLDERTIAITVSGKHKGLLTLDDIMTVDLNGNPVNTQAKPSAETLLHTSLYQLDNRIGAVLHTHSVNATLISRLNPTKQLIIKDYEMQKALSGTKTHETETRVPVFDNTQDMPKLVKEVETYWHANTPMHGYLIRGHGLYTWGETMTEARRHVEAFEFLFACELKLWSLRV